VSQKSAYLQMHGLVLIWSFTAILGKFISLESLQLVWWRLLLTWPVLGLLFFRDQQKITPKEYSKMALVGSLLTLHWVLFYFTIKAANASLALICLTSGSLFAALIEPVLLQKKINWNDVICGLIVIFALLFLFQDTEFKLIGILVGTLASFVSALLTVLNAKLPHHLHSVTVGFFELLSGWIFLTISLLGMQVIPDIPNTSDIFYLLILALVCTAFPFVVSLKLVRKLSPFTMLLSINMEPIYGLFLAALIFGKSEQMSFEFYTITVLIISIIAMNGILKIRSQHKKLSLNQG
jgi:drug/metabolite transporter (DMT)-like permease